jgi:hypothetical protein
LTATTPFTFSAAVASNDAGFAPKRGGCATTTVSMPGSWMSIVKIALPVVLSALSRRATDLSLPISVKAAGSLSVTLAGSGSFDAASANWPKRAWRFDFACAITPFETVISPGFTPHCCAAAWTSIARALAPTWRI